MSRPIYIYVTPFFPSEKNWRGGYCYDAVKALMRTGRYDVRVMVPRTCDDYDYGGVHVFCFRQVAAPCGLAPFVFHRANVKRFYEKLRLMNIDMESVSVLHVNTMDCAMYAVDVHTHYPSVVTLIQHHSLSPVNLQSGRLGVLPIHSTFLYLYYRWMCEKVDAHVFVSQRSKETFGKRFKTTPESKLVDLKDSLLFGKIFREFRLTRGIVLYNGYDSSLYYPKCSPHEGFVIGCVANFQPMKDQLTLLRAIRILKSRIAPLKAVFIGSGVTLEECKSYVRENDLSNIVSFRTEIDHRDLATFYRGLDLFVLPSRMEGFCCAFIEAAACGVPIIGCYGVSIEEIMPVSERDLWLCSPCDEDDFAKKIMNYFISRPVQHFAKDVNIDKLIPAFVQEIETIRDGKEK